MSRKTFNGFNFFNHIYYKKSIFKNKKNKFIFNNKFELEVYKWKSDYATCKLKAKDSLPFQNNDITTFSIITQDGFYSSTCKIIDSTIKNKYTHYKVKVLDPFKKIEKRRFYRLEDNLNIIFNEDNSLNKKYKATSVNISLGGISMDTSRLIINPNNLSFFIDINGQYLKVKGDLVSDPKLVDNAKYNYRVSFKKLNNEQESFLYKYILDKQYEMNAKNKQPIIA